MKSRRFLVAAALLASLPVGPLLAQGAPSTDSGTPLAPAATPAPAPSPAPAATPAPAASPEPAAPAAAESTDKPAAAEKAAETDKSGPVKKRRTSRTSRRQEIEHSLESGTVPSRYRSQVPREYQKYIPFEK